MAHCVPRTLTPTAVPLRTPDRPAWIATSRRLWRLWRRHARARRQFMQFSERELRDIGATRGDLYRESAKPFWRTNS